MGKVTNTTFWELIFLSMKGPKKIVIGLLECEAPYYKPFHRALNSDDVKIRRWKCHNNDIPSSPFECDAWIITGSKFAVYQNVKWIVNLENFVREIAAADQYMVGVCFGHQLIHKALGGKVGKSGKGWNIGLHRITIMNDSLLPFLDKGNDFDIPVLHEDQVCVVCN